MLPEKPYALSCDKNSEPILQVLKPYLKNISSLLEIGAGTGQHAVYMAPHFKNMTWTLSDLEDRHEGISLWLKDFPRANVRGPIEYEAGQTDWPSGDFDAVFTANTLHIMSWQQCLNLFDDLMKLPQGAYAFIYGAFNYNGEFTSESNKKFNDWLESKFPAGGIRDFEKVESELKDRNFILIEDHEMPANNRLLTFQKSNLH